MSRFLEVFDIDHPNSGGAPSMHVLSAEEVSRALDMADCAEPGRIFYLRDDGTLAPVTLGSQNKRPGFADDPTAVYYADSAILADGEPTGHFVAWTDH